MIEWLDVKEKSPPEAQYMLVSNGECVYLKFHENGIFYDGETAYYCPVGRVENITHWMPLPPLPGKKDKP